MAELEGMLSVGVWGRGGRDCDIQSLKADRKDKNKKEEGLLVVVPRKIPIGQIYERPGLVHRLTFGPAIQTLWGAEPATVDAWNILR